MTRIIFFTISLVVLAFGSIAPTLAAGGSPTFWCSICGAPHGNVIGNGICVECNKREFDINPDGSIGKKGQGGKIKK